MTVTACQMQKQLKGSLCKLSDSEITLKKKNKQKERKPEWHIDVIFEVALSIDDPSLNTAR